MIPFSLLMITLYWPDGHTLECRALDLLPDGFTFRLLSEKYSESITSIDRCTLSFLDYSNRTYRHVELKDFSLTPDHSIDSEALHSTGYQIHSADPDFLKEIHRLSKDYLNYIDHKLNPVQYDQEPLGDIQLALSLDSIHMWNQYLKRNPDDFFSFYWRENQLEGHFITEQTVTHLYIGNQFCYHLFPTNETLGKLLNKAVSHNLIPVIVFSTMPEFMIAEYRSRILFLENWCRIHDISLEIVLNDFGIPLLIEEMDASELCHRSNFTFTLGVLLNKRKKDPRMMYPGESTTSINADFYLDYLKKRYNIQGISYETCGYPIETSNRSDICSILHLPLYQTNTSGFCTTFALCTAGDRSVQQTVRTCPHYCETNHVSYPGHPDIVGRFNSLFAESGSEINNREYLRELCLEKIQRLVIRK